MTNTLERTRALWRQKGEGLDAILVFSPANRRYLCGFAGSTGYCVIREGRFCFLVDSRYTLQAGQQCPGWELVAIRGEEDVFDWLRDQGITALGIEADFVTLRFAALLQSRAGITRTQDVSAPLETMRMRKDAAELDAIAEACRLTDLAFEAFCAQVRPGMTEAAIDALLQGFFRQYPQVDRTAERFIVASGPRGALPHGIAGSRPVEKGDFITIDFGCCCYGYWSDVTRTVCLGKASPWQKEIYDVTLEAQNQAIAAVRPGLTGRQIDRIARDIIGKAGYGDYFGHGLGHSFGLEIHENPRLAPNAMGDIPLEEGMILTVEPGIYLPDRGGVRIEDNLVVTADGCRNFTGAPKSLLEL